MLLAMHVIILLSSSKLHFSVIDSYQNLVWWYILFLICVYSWWQYLRQLK